MTSRRILITGLSTYWGGRLAQALEERPEVEAVIGVDRRPPKVELTRTEFVRVADTHSLIRRIVQASIGIGIVAGATGTRLRLKVGDQEGLAGMNDTALRATSLRRKW